MNDKSIRVISFLLIASFINEVISLHLFINKKSNFLLFNAYLLVETFILLYFFFRNFKLSLARKIVPALAAVFLAIWIRQLIRFGTGVYYNDLVIAETVIVLILSLYFYYEKIFKISNSFVYNQPKFWIVTAYFIYFAGTFFVTLYLPSLSTIEQHDYYFLNYVFTIIRTILLCVAMTMKTNLPDEKSKFNLI